MAAAAMMMVIASVQAFQAPPNHLNDRIASSVNRNAEVVAAIRPLFLSTIASNHANEDAMEATRYRNRSDLLEKTLRQKVQALKLSDQKLGVLQDAVKRVMAARTVEQEQKQEQKQEIRQQQQQVANSLVNEQQQQEEMSFVLSVQAQEAQVLEWQARYERAETARVEAVSALADVQRQYHDRKIHSVQAERDRLMEEMQDLQKTYRRDQQQWAADVVTHMAAQRDLVEADQAQQRSLRQVEQLRAELIETQQELSTVRASVQQEQKQITGTLSETETALQRERERFQSLRAQWAELRAEKMQLEQSHVAHAEAMLIAQASVASAERREAALQRDVEVWNDKYNELSKINRELQLKVEEFTAALQQQQAAAVAATVAATHDDGMEHVEDLLIDDPVFSYVVDQDENTDVVRTSSSTETTPSQPSRLKRVASAVFSPARRWRDNRAAKQQQRMRR
jgi:chromosome segregation ATPase